MAVLVTGGAGYVGSHTVRCLVEAQRDVIVLDDLSSGHREALPEGVPLVTGDVGDRLVLDRIFRKHDIDAVLHFAACTQVGESVIDPRRYWAGNVGATIALLEAALDADVARFVFSSTAAVYGTPEAVPITEEEPMRPQSPYAESKLAIERMLASYERAYGLAHASLRYFNACGADPDSGLGERHDPETHLVPLVLDAVLGRRPDVTVFGRDYPTPDGTCIRDYVHVMDLADAHLAALESLERDGASGAFNLGTGTGHSVAEVIAACERITGRRVPVTDGARRLGDPAVLVASPRRAEMAFGWKARRSTLDRIVEDAWAFRLRAHGAASRNAAPSAAE
jgi:UDP-glucose 4-epimerase